ncbi:hypothetical protein HDU76_000178 [Blyttiomyces sp. JEL0837]|nr:hypothetical protein HDU76_000178 [Blyttiomyces sp. JEL0837]
MLEVKGRVPLHLNQTVLEPDDGLLHNQQQTLKEVFNAIKTRMREALLDVNSVSKTSAHILLPNSNNTHEHCNTFSRLHREHIFVPPEDMLSALGLTLATLANDVSYQNRAWVYIRDYPMKVGEFLRIAEAFESQEYYPIQIAKIRELVETRLRSKSIGMDDLIVPSYVGQAVAVTPLGRHMDDLSERTTGLFGRLDQIKGQGMEDVLEDSNVYVLRRNFRPRIDKPANQHDVDLQEMMLIAMFNKKLLLNRQPGNCLSVVVVVAYTLIIATMKLWDYGYKEEKAFARLLKNVEVLQGEEVEKTRKCRTDYDAPGRVEKQTLEIIMFKIKAPIRGPVRSASG